MKHEYHEGPKAAQNFKALAKLVLQKPKKAATPKAKPKRKPAGRQPG